MLAWLLGKVLARHENRAIIKNLDCGYEVVVGPGFNVPVNQNAELWIWHVAREDGQTLYGFASDLERELALQAAEAQGIGPTTAHRFVTAAGVGAITKAVMTGDTGLIPKVPGVGAKKITDIIETLRKKGKVAEVADPRASATLSALRVMGHNHETMTALVAEQARLHPDATPQQHVKHVLPKLPPL